MGMDPSGIHPRLDITSLSLDEPDLLQIRQHRIDRNRSAMQAVDSQIADEVLPMVDNRTEEEKAVVKLQSVFRGYLGRKEYTTRLLQQFEQEEAMRLEKTMKQVEEGELLVENHRLEVQLDDNSTTRRNKSRQHVTHVITIQRAWRSYRQRHHQNGNNNNMSPHLSEAEDLSETESSNGAQAMSLSTPEESEKNLKSEEDNQSDSEKNLKSEDDIQSDFDSTANVESEYDSVQNGSVSVASSIHSSPRKRVFIEPEPESVVSDYSEMADSIKEHLANVQIIQREDLEAGNTMFPNQFSIQQKIVRGPEESEEEFAKRLRKNNFLSLAQEFAELKKINADALPFGLHNKQYQDYSPMSDASTDTDSSERYLSGSATGSNTDTPAVTPMEPSAERVPGGQGHNPVPDNAARTDTGVDDNDNVDDTSRFQRASSLVPMEAWIEALSGAERQNQASDRLAKTSPASSVTATNTPDNHHLASAASPQPTEPRSSTLDSGKQGIIPAHHTSNKSPGSLDISTCHPGSGINTLPHKQNEDRALSRNMAGSSKSVVRDSNSEDGAPDNESREISPAQDTALKKPEMAVGSAGEGVGDFDVYNIETTLPQMDWAMLEEQLQRAAEEEKQKSQSRRNDREEIRRKLAMGGDEEYYGGERMFKKPNLQTRLQGGMNLQICFVNEATSDVESINGDGDELAKSARSSPSTVPVPAAEPKQIQPPPRKQSPPPGKPSDGSSKPAEEEEDMDFFSKQAKLQAEATMALAQVPAMAHMQLEVEKQMRKKSPINEIVRVGIPGFGDGKRRKLNMKILGQMNLAQIQLVVNDLKGQIESLNEELVRLLMERDDLHMEQDSKLVDIEDLTRHAMAPGGPLNQKSMAHAKKAQEYAAKVNIRQAAQKKKERNARK